MSEYHIQAYFDGLPYRPNRSSQYKLTTFCKTIETTVIAKPIYDKNIKHKLSH